jgi:hypothetical protein
MQFHPFFSLFFNRLLRVTLHKNVGLKTTKSFQNIAPIKQEENAEPHEKQKVFKEKKKLYFL